jgi:hypothetical protein
VKRFGQFHVLLLLCVYVLLSLDATAQDNHAQFGIFDGQADVGRVLPPGILTYSVANGT